MKKIPEASELEALCKQIFSGIYRFHGKDVIEEKRDLLFREAVKLLHAAGCDAEQIKSKLLELNGFLEAHLDRTEGHSPETMNDAEREPQDHLPQTGPTAEKKNETSKKQRLAFSFRRTLVFVVFMAFGAGAVVGAKFAYDRYQAIAAEKDSILNLVCRGGPELIETFDSQGKYKSHEQREAGEVTLQIQKTANFKPFLVLSKNSKEAAGKNLCEFTELQMREHHKCIIRYYEQTISYLVKYNYIRFMKANLTPRYEMPNSVISLKLDLLEGELFVQETEYRKVRLNYVRKMGNDQDKLYAMTGRIPEKRTTRTLGCEKKEG